MKHVYRIGIRDLVEFIFLSGDLDLATFSDRSEPREGQKAHRRLQKNRPENYQAEVSVSGSFTRNGIELKLSGRIDGVFSYPDRIVLEEIKSVSNDRFLKQKDEKLQHWAQLKIYAYLYALENGLDQIELQLTYVSLESGKEEVISRSLDIANLQEFFSEAVEGYFIWLGKMGNWIEIRDSSIDELVFPFSRYRKYQKEMAVAVYRSVSKSEHLLIQASTGIGKTAAVLFPAIKAFPRLDRSLIFYLTARTTGKESAEKALRKMQIGGLKFKYLVLTAKQKICFKDEVDCNPEYCEYAKGFFDRLKEGVNELFDSDSFNRERIEELALKHRICPFEFSLALSLWVDCIICDYNYVFDPRIRLKRFFGEDKSHNRDYVILLDEAHNLIDRSRDMFSATLRKNDFLKVRRPLKRRLTRLYRQMGKINRIFLAFLHEMETGEKSEPVLPEKLIIQLRIFSRMAENWLAGNYRTGFRSDLLDLYFDVTRFLKMSDLYSDNYRTCYVRQGRDLKLRLFCLDPSSQLHQILEKCSGAVFFSATLSPMFFFKELIGCRENALTREFPSPFPSENQQILINKRISTYYRDRDNSLPDLAQTIVRFVRVRKGNYLIFLPSYEYMNKLREEIGKDLDTVDMIFQVPDLPEQERQRFISRFDHENEKTLVGFAVMGGIFGEAIDLTGQRLEGAVIVGVGLPGISLERDLIREYFNKDDRGFDYAYKYPGMIRVLQAAGRVIRSETDRGAILLVDKRFGHYTYKKLLAREWKISYVSNPEELSLRLGEFWR